VVTSLRVVRMKWVGLARMILIRQKSPPGDPPLHD